MNSDAMYPLQYGRRRAGITRHDMAILMDPKVKAIEITEDRRVVWTYPNYKRGAWTALKRHCEAGNVKLRAG